MMCGLLLLVVLGLVELVRAPPALRCGHHQPSLLPAPAPLPHWLCCHRPPAV